MARVGSGGASKALLGVQYLDVHRIILLDRLGSLPIEGEFLRVSRLNAILGAFEAV